MHTELLSHLQKALQGELPGDLAHQKMLPPGRTLKASLNEYSSSMMSSVLVLLYPDGDRVFTCLMKRPSTMKHHPGQISFPGGKVEEDDLSAEMTALREAQEEVGIDPSRIQVIGKLSDLYVEVSRFTIQPFLAWTEIKPDFKLEAGEVEELILFPISDFIFEDSFPETEIQTSIGLLSVKYFPCHEGKIWGATAMILAELIEILRNQNNQ
jgi:8-oxo-dGTP pyrophosphatase MutT (NUDIX family)